MIYDLKILSIVCMYVSKIIELIIQIASQFIYFLSNNP